MKKILNKLKQYNERNETECYIELFDDESGNLFNDDDIELYDFDNFDKLENWLDDEIKDYIKACPNCSNKMTIEHQNGYFLLCDNCPIRSHTYRNKERAILEWNDSIG